MLFPNTLILAVLSAVASAAPTHPKFVTFPVTKHHKHSALVQNHLSARQNSPQPLPVPLSNQETFYSVALSLGTPAQNFNCLLDTGSSDLWVYSVFDTTDCVNNACSFTGQFTAADSSTYTFINEDYQIGYVSGSASGNWSTDTLTVGTATLPDFQFAVAGAAPGAIGVFGVALEGSESVSNAKDEYPNFPVQLKNQGYIDRVAYSLYLNSIDANEGTLLLGGIDEAKFNGDLTVLDLQSSQAFLVNYNSINYNGNNYGGQNQAVLDSGTSYVYIPDEAFDPIAKAVGLGALNPNTTLNYIDCNSQVTLDFDFGATTITVETSQLVIPLGPLLGNNDERCVFGIQSYEYAERNIIFGDVFLRNAYVVFDLEGQQVGIAQVQYSDSSNIQPITGPL